MLDTSKNRTRTYERAILSYGITTMVILYNRSFEKKDFNECKLISEVIQEHYKNKGTWGILLCLESMKDVAQKMEKEKRTAKEIMKDYEKGADAIEGHLNKFIS